MKISDGFFYYEWMVKEIRSKEIHIRIKRLEDHNEKDISDE